MIKIFNPRAFQTNGFRLASIEEVRQFQEYQDEGLSRTEAAKRLRSTCKILDPSTKIYKYQSDIAHHTENVHEYGLTCAERFGKHITALLKSDLQNSNTKIGQWFTTCAYDAYVSSGINESRILFNQRANNDRKDDIDIFIQPHNGGKYVFHYLKTSLRERWKQIDRDAIIARARYGKTAKMVGIMYSEEGYEGYLAEINNPKALKSLQLRFNEMETWAAEVDIYVSISEIKRFNEHIEFVKDQ